MALANSSGCMKSENLRSSRLRKFWPRRSTTRTSVTPLAFNALSRLLPMKPAPPVTMIIASLFHGSDCRARLASLLLLIEAAIIICDRVIRSADSKLNCLQSVSRIASYRESVRARRRSPENLATNRRERASIQDPTRISRASAGLEDNALRDCGDVGIERDDRTGSGRKNLQIGVVLIAEGRIRFSLRDKPFLARRFNSAGEPHLAKSHLRRSHNLVASKSVMEIIHHVEPSGRGAGNSSYVTHRRTRRITDPNSNRELVRVTDAPVVAHVLAGARLDCAPIAG